MNYWIIVDNQPAGPYTGEQLVNAGLKPDTLVWRKGYAQWIESGRVPELADMMRSRDMAAASAAPEAAPAPAETETDAETNAGTGTEATADAPAEEPSCTVVEEVEESVTVVEESAPEEPAASTETSAPEEVRPAVPATPAFAATDAPLPQTPQPSAPQTAPTENAAIQAEVPPCPPAYVAWSIIVTILCCTPVGVAAIILSSMTKSAYYKGNLAKSKKYSEITQWLIIAAIVCGTALAPFQAVLMGML